MNESDSIMRKSWDFVSNCLHLDEISSVSNGLGQASQRPLMSEKKQVNLKLKSWGSDETKQVVEIEQHVENFIDSVFAHLNHTQAFLAPVLENSVIQSFKCVTEHANQFGQCFSSLKSVRECKRTSEISVEWNSNFARIGGVPLVVDKRASDYMVGEDDITEEKSGEISKLSSVLKSALAGGLSCAFSAALMHPVDTVKTQVQASTSLTFLEILSKLPQIGVRGLYKGSTPAIVGQFSSHGLRMGLYEASKLVLVKFAPKVPELQVNSVASFSGTVLGTVLRIPCEVLKQRLQVGLFDNVGEAIVRTWQEDGVRGFFRGTGWTLCREVPFYVFGTGLYVQSKKATERILGRELQPWESVLVGAVSGGLTAISTTPFDVIKTRMMTVPQGQKVTAAMVAMSILRHEGPAGLFKGAVPRFFWVAPLGAINFAGYEMLRNIMENW